MKVAKLSNYAQQERLENSTASSVDATRKRRKWARRSPNEIGDSTVEDPEGTRDIVRGEKSHG
jgi:hypothetical protein